MRNNGPVTQIEREFPRTGQIVSSTDTKGIITTANDVFVYMSGYSQQELLGAPHNILRHPDVPKAAFVNLWDEIQHGNSWMGVVKNRAKNGDHYWVDAFVTPVFDGNQIVGYESVRFRPSRECVARAEAAFADVGGTLARATRQRKISHSNWPTFLAATMPPLLAIPFGISPMAGSLIAGLSAAAIFIVNALQTSPLQKLIEQSPYRPHPLLTYIYSGRIDDFGEMQTILHWHELRIRTLMLRVLHDGEQLHAAAMGSNAEVGRALDQIDHQKQETEQIATAVEEMTHAIA